MRTVEGKGGENTREGTFEKEVVVGGGGGPLQREVKDDDGGPNQHGGQDWSTRCISGRSTRYTPVVVVVVVVGEGRRRRDAGEAEGVRRSKEEGEAGRKCWPTAQA